jgi:taurine dioxygenase
MSNTAQQIQPTPSRANHIEITRLQPNVGAQIEGIDLSGPPTPELRDTILGLLFEHQVLFFRDQTLDSSRQRALGRLFGELGTDSTDGANEVQVLQAGGYYGTNWHADATYREQPFFISILRSIVAPELGGDTVYSSGISAYRSLPEDVKVKIGTLTAFHHPHDKAHLLIQDERKREEYLNTFSGAEHPVVISHPHTGAKVLYVNATFTRRIVGLPEQEGAQLLAYLTAQFARPEHQVRFKWRPGCVAIWDNRAVQHYGVADYGTAARRLERVVVKGDRPASAALRSG